MRTHRRPMTGSRKAYNRNTTACTRVRPRIPIRIGGSMTDRFQPPKRRPLFEIVNDLLNHIAASGGEVTDAIDALDLELQDKAEAYVAVIRQLQSEVTALDDLVHQYRVKMERKGNAAAAMRERLAAALERAGCDKIETPTCKAYFAVTTHVQLDHPDAFAALADPRFVRNADPSANLAAVKAAIQAGETVPGAQLVTARHLRIA